MKVKFVPQNIELEIQPNQSVMKLAHENGVYIKSVCGGLPSCAECRVRITEGEQNVLPPSQKELNLIGTGYFIDQRRLSCQLKCFGDVTVDLTEQVAKQATDGPKRPQGSKKDEHEASYAVSGNLIQQDETLKKVAEDLAQNPGGRGRDGGGDRNRGGGGSSSSGSNSGGQVSGGGRNRHRHGRGHGGDRNRDGGNRDGGHHRSSGGQNRGNQQRADNRGGQQGQSQNRNQHNNRGGHQGQQSRGQQSQSRGGSRGDNKG